MKFLAGVFAMLASAAPAMGGAATAQTQIEPAIEASRLSNDSPSWQAHSVRIAHKPAPREVRELTLTQTRRFGLDDQQIGGLYSMPVSERLTATVGGSYSPSHRVLARHGVDGALQYEWMPGWLIQAGIGGRRYDAVQVKQGKLALEHYFSSLSVAVAWHPVRAFGVNSSSAEFRVHHYYGNENQVGLIVSSGQETTSIGADSVVLADVRAVAVTGRHELNRQWALRYAVARTRQGTFYTRNSLQVGAEYRF